MASRLGSLRKAGTFPLSKDSSFRALTPKSLTTPALLPFVLSLSKDERPRPADLLPALSPVEGQARRKGQLTP